MSPKLFGAIRFPQVGLRKMFVYFTFQKLSIRKWSITSKQINRLNLHPNIKNIGARVTLRLQGYFQSYINNTNPIRKVLEFKTNKQKSPRKMTGG